MSTPALEQRPKDAAALNAQEGVVTVADLSLLTGIPTAQLTKFAKSGLLAHYGEYHGKRFFNFQSIVVWASSPGKDEKDDEARTTLRKALESEQRSSDCPYSIEKVRSEEDVFEIRISWKILIPRLAA